MKAGYKQTVVGVIPADWEVKTLGEITSIHAGGTPSTKQPHFWNGTIPWCTPTDITDLDGHKYLRSTPRKITFDGLKFSSAEIIPAGSIVMTSRATIGECAINLINLATNQGLKNFVVVKNINTEFLYYLLSKYKLDFIRLSGGSTFPEITKSQLVIFCIPLPPKAEQDAIADALADVDSLVESLGQLITKKRMIKRGAMQKLLTGKTRLSGFVGEWEIKTLGEIGKIQSGGVDKKNRNNEQSVRLLNYLDVYRKNFIYSGDLFHVVSAPQEQTLKCSIKKGDVFFTPSSEMRDDIGQSAVAMENIPDACYSYHVVRLRLHEKWDLRFRAYAFQTHDFLCQASNICDGSGTRYVISQNKFREMRVLSPPLAEQISIAAILSDMDAEISALEARREKAQQIKQSLMQNLLTGRIRLLGNAAVQIASHNRQFEDAVIVGVLSGKFSSKEYPLGRVRRTKFAYFLARYLKKDVSHYVKAEMGPYDPSVKYGGAEKIALDKDYVRNHQSGKRLGFISGKKTDEAFEYFYRWHGDKSLAWLEKFRREKNEELKLLSTIDMAMQELCQKDMVSVVAVKSVIAKNKKWRPKLSQKKFSDENIGRAIEKLRVLFIE